MSRYALPFEGDKLIELGGGKQPLIRPNVDVRACPEVDIVADLGEPLSMLASNAYDGVFSRFAIEHISWRKVRGFISETHRILRPGGTAVFVTANLLEQARKLTQAHRWDDNLVGMVFGDNDYPENTHRCGFSPDYATTLMRQAGFLEVRVMPLPECPTDMVIEARKSRARISVATETVVPIAQVAGSKETSAQRSWFDCLAYLEQNCNGDGPHPFPGLKPSTVSVLWLLAEVSAARSIIEIGIGPTSASGCTFLHSLARRKPAHLISVDIDRSRPLTRYRTLAEQLGVKWTTIYGDCCLRMSGIERGCDLYVDGDHDKAHALGDNFQVLAESTCRRVLRNRRLPSFWWGR